MTCLHLADAVAAVDAVAEMAPPAKRARRAWQPIGSVTATRDATQHGGAWASFTATLTPDESESLKAPRCGS